MPLNETVKHTDTATKTCHKCWHKTESVCSQSVTQWGHVLAICLHLFANLWQSLWEWLLWFQIRCDCLQKDYFLSGETSPTLLLYLIRNWYLVSLHGLWNYAVLIFSPTPNKYEKLENWHWHILQSYTVCLKGHCKKKKNSFCCFYAAWLFFFFFHSYSSACFQCIKMTAKSFS